MKQQVQKNITSSHSTNEEIKPPAGASSSYHTLQILSERYNLNRIYVSIYNDSICTSIHSTPCEEKFNLPQLMRRKPNVKVARSLCFRQLARIEAEADGVTHQHHKHMPRELGELEGRR